VDAWPLVGRRDELARLTAVMVARGGAVITGSPGVGKTTLAMTATRASRRLPVHGSAGVDTGKAVRHQTS
jgi:MoxR-like ATPase